MSSKKLASLIIKIQANGAQAEAELKKMERKVQDVGKSVKRIGDNMTKYVTVPLTALGALSVKVANTQLQAEAKLLTALKGREDVQKRLMAQASELQSRSLFGDEAIIEQQAYLAALGLSEQQISATIEAAAQLSAALGIDLTSAVKNLAKTYGGMTGELGESIPALKSLTKEQLMAGEAIKYVNENYKGFAETAAAIGAGPLVQLKNKLGDLAEQVGAILLPVLDKLVSLLSRLADRLAKMPESTRKWVVGIGAAAAAVGPLLNVGASLIRNFDSIYAIIPKIGSALSWLAAHPIVLVGAAVAVLIVKLTTLESALERLQREENELQAEADAEEARLYSSLILSHRDDIETLRQLRAEKMKEYGFWTGQGGEILTPRLKLEYGGDNVREQAMRVAEIKAIDRAIKDLENAGSVVYEIHETFEETEKPLTKAVGLITELQERITALEDKKLLATSKEEIGAINMQLAELNAQLKDIENYQPPREIIQAQGISLGGVSFGVSGPQAQGLEGEIPNTAFDNYTEQLSRAEEMTKRTSDVLNNTLRGAFRGVFNLAAEGLEAVFSGEQFDWVGRICEFLGETLKKLGAGLIATAELWAAFKASLGNPAAAIVTGIAAMAAGAALVAYSKSRVPKLATGGLAYSPTLAVVGDNAGAANDPEVIAPLSKLRSYMGGQRLELVGEIEWELRGDKLRALLNRDNIRLATLG